ncbi:MAG: hypothetical protein HKP27_05895 [Myxococcales bacterium]|nr:hypothetical protein [Myxococcales bacterium]
MSKLVSFAKQFSGGLLLAAALAIAPGGVTLVHAGASDQPTLQTVRGPVSGAHQEPICAVDEKSAVAKAEDAHRAMRAKLEAEMEAAKADGTIRPLDGNGYNYALEDQQRAELIRAAREAAGARH